MSLYSTLRDSRSETSKKIIGYTGFFVALQVYATMALVCIFPNSGVYLNPICLSCIAGYLTLVSWYFHKAGKENQLKISKSLDGVLTTIRELGATPAKEESENTVETTKSEG